ncbi:nucleotidyltransferase family protein [Ruegeria hyattellae]|uniref:nucleotidyltransferase family protein n=1 Tax=Ruegeria hyattellae TaxID=3233337 RepID=UPI00355B8785
MNNRLSEQHKNAIAQWAAQHPIIRKVVLFGNRARGTQTANSDFDLAIQVFPASPHRHAQMAYMDWKDRRVEDLEAALNHKVQLEWFASGAGLAIERSIKDEGVTIFFRQNFAGEFS